MGGRAIACLNARDRNVLGFRRDLLTAAAYGVNEFLFVYGDRPESGSRSDDLTVRSMITEARGFASAADPWTTPLRIGVTSRLQRLPDYKRDADFVFAQVCFDIERLWEWRAQLDFVGPVYAGVMVVASAPMARKLSADIPELAVPPVVIEAVERDSSAGITIACDLIEQIRESAAFDGVHLIAVKRYREVASRLETSLNG